MDIKLCPGSKFPENKIICQLLKRKIIAGRGLKHKTVVNSSSAKTYVLVSNCKSTLDSVDEPCLAVRQKANFFLGSRVNMDSLLSSVGERVQELGLEKQAFLAISRLERNRSRTLLFLSLKWCLFSPGRFAWRYFL